MVAFGSDFAPLGAMGFGSDVGGRSLGVWFLVRFAWAFWGLVGWFLVFSCISFRGVSLFYTTTFVLRSRCALCFLLQICYMELLR
jgi:hypothetical protein